MTTPTTTPAAPTGLAQKGTASSGGTIEIAGRSSDAAGDTIKLYADGNTTAVVGTGTVKADGSFDITTTATFADGTHAITATDTSADGTETSAASIAFAAAVGAAAPTGLAQRGTAINGGSIEVTGKGDVAGDTIKLHADGDTTTVVGTGTVKADGSFDITTTATFANGSHSIIATDTSADGTQISAASNALTAIVLGGPPTISPVTSPQSTTSESAITPFRGVSIGDTNVNASETLTIAVGGSGGVLSGTELSGGANGVYTLNGSAATVTSNLDALSFTPTADRCSASSEPPFGPSFLRASHGQVSMKVFLEAVRHL